MKFRPCIDIHNGQVKQIVGGSLSDINNFALENFVSEYTAGHYARLYKSLGLKGGHIILLNPENSEFYQANCVQAFEALSEFPDGFHIGGGITDKNAEAFLQKGASHVIVTSFVFRNGEINMKSLDALLSAVGKNRLVLDLSCRKKNGEYFIVTDRWQNFTEIILNKTTLHELSKFCDEFLIHAVDAEGKSQGIETELVKILADCVEIPITYAGGVGSFEHLIQLKSLGKDKIDVTVGSALDIFGGEMSFEKTVEFCQGY